MLCHLQNKLCLSIFNDTILAAHLAVSSKDGIIEQNTEPTQKADRSFTAQYLQLVKKIIR